MTTFVTFTRDASTGVRIVAGANLSDSGVANSWYRVELAPMSLVVDADVQRLVVALQNAPSTGREMQQLAIKSLEDALK